MPREKQQYKYQCKEPSCNLMVRSDKWNDHCKNKHGYKFLRVKMQQQPPANTSEVQVTVLTHTAPMDTQNRYRNMTTEFVQKYNALGLAHIAFGALCVLFQITSLSFWPSGSGAGIWTGILFIVTGAFGILAGKRGGKCQVITFHVLSIISAGFALVLFCEATAYAVITSWSSSSFAMEILLILFSVGEGTIAICSSVIGCQIGICCCNCGGSCCCPTDTAYQQFVNPVQPDLAQQQFMTDNQQQPTLNTNPQQSVFNPNQQQPTLNTNQQQLMFNPTQQEHMFNPNQQQLMFNPFQQQQMFNSNQQQLMFNPNQQQLMFNPTQQQQMFNPNQQQMFNSNQQPPAFIPNQQQLMFIQKSQQPMFNPGQQQLVFNPNQQLPVFLTNQQQPVFLPNQLMTGFYPQQNAPQHLAHSSTVLPNPPQPASSASSSETTGEEANTVEYDGIATLPTDTIIQSSGERPSEGLIRFNSSEAAIPGEAPPPYDNTPGWNYSNA